MGEKMGTEAQPEVVKSDRPARRYVIILIGFLVLFLAALFNDSWLLFRATYVLGLAGIFGFLWTLLNSTRSVKASFSVPPGNLESGKVLDLTLSVHNSSRLPRLWLEVSLTSSLPGDPINRLLSLKGDENREWSVSISSLKRGLYTIGPLNVASRDLFGLFVQRDVHGEAQEIIVFPETVNLPYFDPWLGEKGKTQLSRKVRDFLFTQVGGIRPYVSGDSFRRIHWPSTVRTGKLMVKVLESHSTDDVWLVLDMQEKVHSSDGVSEEHLVKAAASVAKALLEAGQAVGLIYYSKERCFIEAGRGKDQLFNILRVLAIAEAKGRIPVYRVIGNELLALSRGSSCIVFTTSPEPEVVFAVEDLRHEGISPRIVVLKQDNRDTRPLLPDLMARLRVRSHGVYIASPGRPLSDDLNDMAPVAPDDMPVEVK